MIKKTLILFSAITLLIAYGASAATNKANDDKKKSITVKGTVKFDDPQFKMSIYKRAGFDKIVIGEFDINPDGTFKYEMKVDEPGVYTIDCKKWESLDFWAEDENIDIDFRGLDTAKMKIKNPPYHMIKNAGPKNEVMNQLNFLGYRNYQLMIGVCNAAWRIDGTQEQKSAQQGILLEVQSADMKARCRFIAETYADRNSALAVLGYLNPTKDADVINMVISRLEAIDPTYAPLVKYKNSVIEAQKQRERLEIGQPAPDFSFPTPEGKNIALKDYRGKLVVVDFWASWCGPCRQEIPHMKEVYAKYKSKGVEVLGVSIDKKDTDWKKALSEEKMPWPQICAPGAGKDLMKEYQFSGIPYIILVGKDGKILAKGLRGTQVDAAIEEALAK